MPQIRALNVQSPRWYQHLGLSGAIWLLLSVATLFMPLVQSLGYESALALNLIVVGIGGPRALGRWLDLPCWERFWRRSADLAVLALISGLITSIHALRIRNCDLVSGFGFWLMFGLLSIPPVVALGMLSERIGQLTPRVRNSAVIFYLATILVSLCASGLWLALQPPLIVYDAFAGFWAVSIYDEALRPWYSHWPFRLMTLIGTALWLQSLAFEERPQRSGFVWLASLAVGLGLFAYFSGPLDITRSRAYTQELLGGKVDTEHFVIYYEAAGFSKPDLILLVADHELRYDELREFWGIEPDQKLHSYIYASRETRAKAMGSRSTMIARVWLREMHLTYDEFGAGLLAHEMAHLFLRDAGRGPLRLSSANGLLPLMGLVEGAASAAAWEIDELDDHGWAAAILRHELVGNIDAMIGAASFWSQPSGVAYTLWSSFCRWLIEEQGPALFLDAYRDGNLERVYERPRAELFAEWAEALAGIELRDAEEAAALMRFERPSLLRRSCGRAIAEKELEASVAIGRRNRLEAARCVEWLERTEPGDPYLQFRVGRSWELLERPERARSIYEGLLQREGLGEALAQQVRLQLADLAWRAEEDAGALAWLDAIRSAPRTDAMERNLWVRQLLIEQRAQYPRAYHAGRNYLTHSWNYRGLDLRLDLLSAALVEDSLPLAWLAYRMSARSELGATAESLAARLRDAMPDAMPVLRPPPLASAEPEGAQFDGAERTGPQFERIDATQLEESPRELVRGAEVPFGEPRFERELPPSVRERFMLDELGRWSRQGHSSHCDAFRALETTSAPFGNAIADEATMLRERCEVSGLYLDAARRAVE